MIGQPRAPPTEQTVRYKKMATVGHKAAYPYSLPSPSCGRQPGIANPGLILYVPIPDRR